jgi:hypothetical protein
LSIQVGDDSYFIRSVSLSLAHQCFRSPTMLMLIHHLVFIVRMPWVWLTAWEAGLQGQMETVPCFPEG